MKLRIFFAGFLKTGGAIFLFALFALLAVTMFSTNKQFQDASIAWGYKPLIVLSGSMEPMLPVGGLIIVNQTRPDLVNVGDVITFRHKNLITHRVVAIENQNGVRLFRTKGDANATADINPVTEAEIYGRLSFTIPYVGYLSGFIKTPIGFVLLFLLPGICVIALEIRRYLRIGDSEAGIEETADAKSI